MTHAFAMLNGIATVHGDGTDMDGVIGWGFGYGWLFCVVQVQSVTGMGVLIFTLCSRVRHWDRLWSSAVKGEGMWLVLSCCHPTLWILP